MELADKLRAAGDGIEPEVDDEHFMKPEFAQHQKLMREAADAMEKMEARYVALQCIAGTLAVHVQGHFAMPDENSEAICKKWAAATHDEATGKTV